MKEEEIRKAADCYLCGNKIGKTGIFYKVKIEEYLIDIAACNRQQGLTMMLGGSAALASVMGPNEDLANKTKEKTIYLCGICGNENVGVHINSILNVDIIKKQEG